MHIYEKKSPENPVNLSKKIKPKVNLAISPRNIDPSPPSKNINLHHVHRKHENIGSPQNSRLNIRPSPNRFQMSKPFQ